MEPTWKSNRKLSNQLHPTPMAEEKKLWSNIRPDVCCKNPLGETALL